MKVKDIIQKLQKMNPEDMAVVNGYEGGVNEISSVEPIKLKLNINSEWYYGKHEIEEDGDVSGVFIG